MKLCQKRKGFTLLELTAVLIVVGILLAVGLYYYGGVQRDAKISATKSELQTIATAAATYGMLAKKPVSASNGAELLVELKAEDSVDGVKHERFLSDGRWNKNGEDKDLSDPWGTKYKITYGKDRTVECIPSDTSIEKMVQKF